MTRLLVTIGSESDSTTVADAGGEILAEYPNSLLVEATPEQEAALEAAGLDTTRLEPEPILLSGFEFDFDSALATETRSAVQIDVDRRAFYLAKLIGPATNEWLDDIAAAGATVLGALETFTVLVGMMPADVPRLAALRWVEAVTPYRPGMKLSRHLRPDVRGVPDVATLEVLGTEVTDSQSDVAVEITVFPGEGTDRVLQLLDDTGAQVLSRRENMVAAIVAEPALGRIAAEQSVQTVAPREVLDFDNDVAAEIIGAVPAPVDAGVPLRGSGQLVAMCDSGLDTGDASTIHPDFAGRVDAMHSWPMNAGLEPFVKDPPVQDDGPADRDSAHGTHVAGSILGNGAAAAAANAAAVPSGVAPDAAILVQAVEQRLTFKSEAELANEGIRPFREEWPPDAAGLYGLPDDIAEVFDQARRGGARIHTNSWGSRSNQGAYTSRVRDVDEFAFQHPDFLVLFSAGNSGRDFAAPLGTVDPDSIGTPGTAKNVVTVGASENRRPPSSTPTPGDLRRWSDQQQFAHLTAAGLRSDNPEGMAGFSSRGPTDDRRIKPDVVAPGTNILSTRPTIPGSLRGDIEPTTDPLHGLYRWSNGTSMSTPLVAGAVALIRERLTRGANPVEPDPPSCLLKALLINGATPMAGQFPGEIPAGPGPNNVCGFGRVDVAQSLMGGTNFSARVGGGINDEDSVQTGSNRLFRVTVPDSATELRATLVWTDAPGPDGVGGLQNKLYLRLTAPDGTRTDGDVSPFPNPRNNVQRIVVPNPAPGEYEVRVLGVQVTVQSPRASTGNGPRQDFALVTSVR